MIMADPEMGKDFDPLVLKKLRLDKAHKILILNAPSGFLKLLTSLDYDTEFQSEASGQYDFVQIFGASRTELESLLVRAGKAARYDGLFWACYPKGGGQIRSDLKRELVWAGPSLIQLRPVSQISLDETWSALRGRPTEMVGKVG